MPAAAMKKVTIPSTATLSNVAILWFVAANPPVGMVLKVMISEWKNGNLAISSAISSKTDIVTYIISRTLAERLMRSVSCTASGPGPASADTMKAAPTPSCGRTATKNMTMPMPPNHCVRLRHTSMPWGSASIFTRTDDPVVVKPDIDSK